MKYKTITLAARQGLQSIEAQAIPCGFFAVHATNGAPLRSKDAGSFFSISHIATGYLAGVVEGRQKAINVAKLYTAVLDGADITEQDFQPAWSGRYRACVVRWKAIAAEHGVK